MFQIWQQIRLETCLVMLQFALFNKVTGDGKTLIIINTEKMISSAASEKVVSR